MSVLQRAWRRLRWPLLVLLLLAGAGAAVFSLGRQPAPLPEGSDSAHRLALRVHPYTTFDVRLVDDARVTERLDGVVLPSRSLRTTVWHPTDTAQPRPLVVFSHGYLSQRHGGDHLAAYLATRGWVVVAADYPLTTLGASGGPVLLDVASQPRDVAFLIDTVLDWNEQDGHRLEGRVDPDRIGVAGVSLGGLTSTLAGYHDVLRDPRIDAVASIAGPMAMFEPAFFETPTLPFLMLASRIDAIVPYAVNGGRTLDLVPGATLATLDDGSHSAFSSLAVGLRWLDNPDQLGCLAVKQHLDERRGDEAAWRERLGRDVAGLRVPEPAPLCEADPLPPAMNAIRQVEVVALVVGAFLEAHLDPDPAVREAAARYLRGGVAEAELEGLTITSSRPAPAP